MSNVYLFALSGLNSARQAQVLAARTISVGYTKPSSSAPQGYGAAPRDRIDITGGQGRTQLATYEPPKAGGAPGAPAGGIESAAVQSIAARQAFAANAKVLETYAKTQQTLLDVTT